MANFSTLLRATGLAVTVAMPVAAQDASTVMATVNGTPITLGHMIALQQRLPEQYKELEDDVLFKGILEQLIQQTALSQEMQKDTSRALDLGLENEMRAFLAGEMLARAGQADVDEADIEAAYKAEFGETDSQEEYNASHILVETQEAATELKKRLDDGADFAEVAKEASTGPSGPSGGSLGWFGQGAMVPAFETAVIALEDGQVSDPVETQFGWHVIKRNESRAKAAPQLSVVRDQIEQKLRSDAIDAAVEQIADAAEITREEVEVDPSMIRNVDLLAE